MKSIPKEMKRFPALVFWLIVPILPLFSQNFECIKTDDIYFYECTFSDPGDELNEVRAYRVDSTHSQGDDLILFAQREILDNAPDSIYGCWDPKAPGWIGDVRVSPEGDYFFSNDVYTRNLLTWELDRIHETMCIKSRAGIGDSWDFYTNDSLGTYSIATVTAMDTMTFLGITDSVKIISVSRGPGWSSLFELQLSKHHGLIRTINFRNYFPGEFYWFASPVSHIHIYELSGIESFTGMHSLTRGEIYDYEVGDVFHELVDFEDNQGNPLAHQYIIRTILDKNLSPDQDTVRYTYDHFSWTITSEGTIFYHDTLHNEYSNLEAILPYPQALPYESIYVNPEYVNYYDMKKGYGGRQYFHDIDQYYVSYEGDSCFYDVFFIKSSLTSPMSYTEYIQGCGSYFTKKYDPPALYACQMCSYLEYYKKGSLEWGNPFTIPVNVEEKTDLEVNVTVYPNPADEFIYLESGNSSVEKMDHYELLDLSGARLLTGKFDRGSSGIYIGNLPGGMYFLKIVTRDNLMLFHKVIVEH